MLRLPSSARDTSRKFRSVSRTFARGDEIAVAMSFSKAAIGISFRPIFHMDFCLSRCSLGMLVSAQARSVFADFLRSIAQKTRSLAQWDTHPVERRDEAAHRSILEGVQGAIATVRKTVEYTVTTHDKASAWGNSHCVRQMETVRIETRAQVSVRTASLSV